MDPAKLKVVELRAELAARGLDQKGVKAVLVSRLQAALEREQQNLTTNLNLSAQQEAPNIATDQYSSQQQFQVQTESRALPDTSLHFDDQPLAFELQHETPIQDDSNLIEQQRLQQQLQLQQQQQILQQQLQLQQQQQQQHYYQQETEAQYSNQNDDDDDDEEEEGSQSSQSASASGSENESNDDENNYDQNYEMSSAPMEQQQQQQQQQQPITTDSVEIEKSEKMETDDTEKVAEFAEEKLIQSDINNESNEPIEAEQKIDTEFTETNVATEPVDESPKNGNEDSVQKSPEPEKEKESTDKEAEKSDGRKRKRSRSKSKSPPAKRANRMLRSPARNTDDFTNEEDEPEFDENAVLLSWYDSDLNLTITKPDLCSARPLSDGALALAWAGARATYGVDKGKVCYEVQVNEINRIQNLSDERNLYELRCGWSILSDNLQLGEAPSSFGYSGCAKKANDTVFSEYGIKYGSRGDVVGVYLDMDSTPCTIEYTVNGAPQGTAFEFNKEDLNGAALYPHVLTKNLAFTVNFGQCSKLLVNEERPNRARREESSRRDSNRRSNKDTTKSSSPASDDKTKSESESQKKSDEKADSVEKEQNDENDEKDEKPDKLEKAESNDDSETDEKAMVKDDSKETEESAEQEKSPVSENGESKDAKIGGKDKPNELQQKEYALLPGYELIGNVDIENLVRGYVRPKTRNECEVILLIGLPGAGKTHWANQHSKENVEKHYNILGVQNLLSKMTVCGESRKKHHSYGRWERFIDWATRGLHSIQDIAVKKRRNYILDQTNVLASAQRRKMKGYGDFKRIAAVIIPDEGTFKERCEKQTEKIVSENALNEMKANFTLPSPDFGWFDEVIYTELDEEDAKKKVQEFNEKGKKLLKERERDSDRGNRRRDDNRDRYGRDRRNWGQSSSDRRWRHQPNSSSQWMHGRAGGMRSDGNSGRSRDKWHGSSGGGGSGGGGGGSSNWGNRRYDYSNNRDRRHDDRRGGSRSDRDYKDSRDKRGGDKHGSKREKDNHSSSRGSYSSKSSSSNWSTNKGYDRSHSMSSNSRSYGGSFGSMSSSNNWASATSNYTPQQQQWLQWQQQGPIMQANQHQNQQQHQPANNTQWWQQQQQQQQATGNHQGWQNWATYAQAYASNSNGANMAKK